MNRILISVVLTVCWTGSVLGQSDTTAEVALTLNRISATLRLAHSESEKAGSELELVDEQKKQLARLRADYKELVQEFYQLETEEQNDKAALARLVAKMPLLEETLKRDILLPHQVKVLNAKVFNQFVLKEHGNLLKALAQNYPDEFQLDAEQTKKLHQIEDRLSEEMAELKKRYEKEMEKIRNKARDEAKKTLTKDQLKRLQQYSDR